MGALLSCFKYKMGEKRGFVFACGIFILVFSLFSSFSNLVAGRENIYFHEEKTPAAPNLPYVFVNTFNQEKNLVKAETDAKYLPVGAIISASGENCDVCQPIIFFSILKSNSDHKFIARGEANTGLRALTYSVNENIFEQYKYVTAYACEIFCQYGRGRFLGFGGFKES